MDRNCAILLTTLTAITGICSAADPIEGGYREVRHFEKSPITSVRMEERMQTVYTPETVTEMRTQQRAAWVPVTTYEYQPRWPSRSTPFSEPTFTHELRPVTRWQLRMETVTVPVTTQQYKPEVKIVQVPVRSLGFVEREVVERVAVQTLPAGQSPGSQLAGGQSASRTLAPARASPARPARLATSNLHGSPNLDGSRSVPAMGAGTVRR